MEKELSMEVEFFIESITTYGSTFSLSTQKQSRVGCIFYVRRYDLSEDMWSLGRLYDLKDTVWSTVRGVFNVKKCDLQEELWQIGCGVVYRRRCGIWHWNGSYGMAIEGNVGYRRRHGLYGQVWSMRGGVLCRSGYALWEEVWSVEEGVSYGMQCSLQEEVWFIGGNVVCGKNVWFPGEGVICGIMCGLQEKVRSKEDVWSRGGGVV